MDDHEYDNSVIDVDFKEEEVIQGKDRVRKGNISQKTLLTIMQKIWIVR